MSHRTHYRLYWGRAKRHHSQRCYCLIILTPGYTFKSQPFRLQANSLPGAKVPIRPWPIRSLELSFTINDDDDDVPVFFNRSACLHYRYTGRAAGLGAGMPTGRNADRWDGLNADRGRPWSAAMPTGRITERSQCRLLFFVHCGCIWKLGVRWKLIIVKPNVTSKCFVEVYVKNRNLQTATIDLLNVL